MKLIFAGTPAFAAKALEAIIAAGHEVALAISGIGKVAAAHTATLLARHVSALLVVGTAGGLGAGVGPGDVVVATAALQHDLDARPLFDRWVQPESGLSRFPVDPAWTRALLAAADQVVSGQAGAGVTGREPRRHAGLLVSGDRFIGSAKTAQRLRRDLPDALAVDMESAAVAQVCHAAGTPIGIVRTISDRADGDAGVDFGAFVRGAARLHRDLVITALAAQAEAT